MLEEKNTTYLNEEQTIAAMELIVNSSKAKNLSFEAIDMAKKGEFPGAHEKLGKAQEFLVAAHNSQTKILAQEAGGRFTTIQLLTIHSQDHLMNAITFNDLAKEIVSVYEELITVKMAKS